jgi:hypothetical protein
VQTLDPKHDPILLGRAGLTAGEVPVVHLAVGNEPRGTANTPQELIDAIARIERERRKDG